MKEESAGATGGEEYDNDEGHCAQVLKSGRTRDGHIYRNDCDCKEVLNVSTTSAFCKV